MTTNVKSVFFLNDEPEATPAIAGTVKVNYRTCEGCVRCTTDPYVPHYNCLYGGNATGHSAAHCTANACY